MYEKALKLDPEFAAAYAVLSYARIWLHWQFGRYEELAKAKVALDKAVTLDPESPKTRMALGYYYYWGSRDNNNALKQFNLVQKQQPSNAEVHAAIGYIKRRQGLWEKAITSLKKALELDPRNHFIAVNLGRTYLRLRRYVEAENYLDRAISLAPDIPVYYLRKVTLYISWDGSTKRARQALDEASGKVDTKDLAITRGRLEAFDGNYEKAIEMLGEQSDSTRYKLYRAFFHHLMGQEDSAKEFYESAHADLAQIVKEQPDNPFGLRELGIAYAGTGNIEEAIMTGNKAVEMLPVTKDAFYGPDILENLAWIYMMSNDFATAVDKLEYLLSIPSRISVPRLRIDSRWTMLRDNKRFKKLIN
jgi:tetratricopeptide (TPR) repeat protein